MGSAGLGRGLDPLGRFCIRPNHKCALARDRAFSKRDRSRSGYSYPPKVVLFCTARRARKFLSVVASFRPEDVPLVQARRAGGGAGGERALAANEASDACHASTRRAVAPGRGSLTRVAARHPPHPPWRKGKKKVETTSIIIPGALTAGRHDLLGCRCAARRGR